MDLNTPGYVYNHTVIDEIPYKTILSKSLQKLPFNDACAYVSIPMQKLFVLKEGKIRKMYIISTSKNLPSCTPGSYGTPLGLHYIIEKFGEGQPTGMIFQSRKPIGIKYTDTLPEDLKGKDLITTRILWLQGLEEGINDNSKDRYIYIHGTDHEEELGKPVSHGCIRMKNTDVIDLYNQLLVGAQIYIDNDN